MESEEELTNKMYKEINEIISDQEYAQTQINTQLSRIDKCNEIMEQESGLMEIEKGKHEKVTKLAHFYKISTGRKGEDRVTKQYDELAKIRSQIGGKRENIKKKWTVQNRDMDIKVLKFQNDISILSQDLANKQE